MNLKQIFKNNYWSIMAGHLISNVCLFGFNLLFFIFQLADYFYFFKNQLHLFSIHRTTLTRLSEHPHFWGIILIELIPFLLTFINQVLLKNHALYFSILHRLRNLFYLEYRNQSKSFHNRVGI
ncbi:hypothetical protein CDG61_15640 [Acinetobacter sp. WCHAc010052]|nr:hypothetical protein CDG61_15640 [Acinetobacter sp. WCHAc010052]